jgi:hypothetical protein
MATLSQAQPWSRWHSLLALMHVSPHAWPCVHTLQHVSAGTQYCEATLALAAA